MSATELAKALDSPLSSMVDVLRCLASLGYVAYDPRSRSYYPTMRLGMLGEWLTTNPLDHTSFQHLMQTLRDSTLETIGVFWQNDTHMKCVAAVQGGHSITVSLKPGDNLAMFGSAVGTALLTKWTEEDIRKAHARHLTRSDNTIPTLDECLETVALAREQGYAVGYDLVTEGLGAIAAPCAASAGRWMVFSIAGVSERIRARESEFGRALVDGLTQASN